MFAKVTPAEGQKITQEFYNQLRPAVLKHPNENNSALLTAFLQGRDLDITSANLMKAAKALVGSLDWETPPKSRPKKEFQDEGRTGRPNHANPEEQAAFSDPTGIKSLCRAAIAEAELQHEKKNQKALGRCEALIRNFRRTPHSRSYQGRDRLAAELARLRTVSSDGVKIEKALLEFEKQIP